MQAVVSARLDHLPPRLREVARHASVFFVSFDLDELRLVDPQATTEEVVALEAAERQHGLRTDDRVTMVYETA